MRQVKIWQPTQALPLDETAALFGGTRATRTDLARRRGPVRALAIGRGTLGKMRQNPALASGFNSVALLSAARVSAPLGPRCGPRSRPSRCQVTREGFEPPTPAAARLVCQGVTVIAWKDARKLTKSF